MTSAIDADGTVIGTFPTQRQAADALEAITTHRAAVD